jgi:hypothetical protein
MAVLIEVRGDQQREFRLAARDTVGRGASSSVKLIDPLVSAEHATITRGSDNRYRLTDAGSRHGTFVGGERVTEHLLADGDEVIVGATRLRFHQTFESISRRRWDERLDCEVPVTVTLATGETIETRALDLSLGGLRLEAAMPAAVGDEVGLSILFPGRSGPVQARARVAHRNEESGRVGVAFRFTSDAASIELAEEYAKLLRR